MGYCYYQTMPRCGAYARSSGRPCLQAAMANGRCYIHGGKSKIKHGRYTKQNKQKNRDERQSIKDLRNMNKSLKETINE